MTLNKETLETEVKREAKALGFSIAGILAAWNDQPSFRTLSIASAVLFVLALFLGETLSEKLLLIGSLAIMLMAELFNCAIESLTNLAHPGTDPLAKKTKDQASGAVFVTIVLAAFVWLVVLIF